MTGAPLSVRDSRGGDFFYRLHSDLHYMPALWARWVVEGGHPVAAGCWLLAVRMLGWGEGLVLTVIVTAGAGMVLAFSLPYYPRFCRFLALVLPPMILVIQGWGILEGWI